MEVEENKEGGGDPKVRVQLLKMSNRTAAVATQPLCL